MAKQTFLLVTALTMITLQGIFGCGSAEEPPASEAEAASSDRLPRLVLLYAPCSVNKEFLSPWNESRTFTPNLAAFAAKSKVFARHQTEAGQSGISYASIFTGSQADHHQVYRHPAVLADELYLIAEAYSEAGYESFYWNGHEMASGDLNYAQGVPAPNLFAGGLTARDPRFSAILERLARDPDYKAFVVTNFEVTHSPYRETHVARFMREYPDASLGVTAKDIRQYSGPYRRNHLGLTWSHLTTLKSLGVGDDFPKFRDVIELLYRANINELDRLFGEVIDEVSSSDLLDNSLIVFTADHGEVMYRESATFKWTHSMLLDHEVIGIPLIMHSGAIDRPGTAYAGVTRSMDVFPTMAGLSGITLPEDAGIQGVDVSEMLKGTLPPERLIAFSHTTVLVKSVMTQMNKKTREHNWLEARRLFPDDDVNHIWVALRDGDQWFKLRKLATGSWGTQAFDLAVDPAANKDIYDQNNVEHLAKHQALTNYKTRLIENYAGAESDATGNQLPTEDEARLLRQLGYIE